MGKVLGSVTNGFPGAISRSVDNVVVSLRNASGGSIPFGAPIFAVSGEKACTSYNASTSSAANFIGIAVREPAKTPDEYGSSTADFAENMPVDILARGAAVLQFSGMALPGSDVYYVIESGLFSTSAGASGSTIQIPNAKVVTSRDRNNCAEVVITKRNFY